jgi:hypothetical protein
MFVPSCILKKWAVVDLRSQISELLSLAFDALLCEHGERRHHAVIALNEVNRKPHYLRFAHKFLANLKVGRERGIEMEDLGRCFNDQISSKITCSRDKS